MQNRNDIESIINLFQTVFDEDGNICWTNSAKQSIRQRNGSECKEQRCHYSCRKDCSD